MKSIYFLVFCSLILFAGCREKKEMSGMMHEKEMTGMTHDGMPMKSEESMMKHEEGMPHEHEQGMSMHHEEKMTETKMPASSESGVVIRKARPDEIGKSVVCPVMGTKFDVKAFTEAADYKGKSYYFCCAMCPPEFKKNPDKYAK